MVVEFCKYDVVRSFCQVLPLSNITKAPFFGNVGGCGTRRFLPRNMDFIWFYTKEIKERPIDPAGKSEHEIFISKLRVHQLHRWVEAQLHGFSSRKGAQGSEYFGSVAVKTQGPKDYVKFNLWGLLWFGFRILLTAWCYMKCKNDWHKKNKLTYPTIYSIPMHFMETYYTSWWFQPLWKILVKMGIFPK